MDNYLWRSFCIKVFIAIFCVSILCFAFSFLGSDNITGKDLVEETDLSVGKTVFAGDTVLSENEKVNVPFISNIGFIVPQILNLDLKGIVATLSTGTVPIPANEISSGGISSVGHATGFEGPGYLALDGENLVVIPPANFVWGDVVPYKVLTKIDNGVNVVDGGEVIDFIEDNKIRTTDFGNETNSSEVAEWYNVADNGQNYTIGRGIGYFSDNRSSLSIEDANSSFGADVAKNIKEYPLGSPVLVFAANFTEESGGIFATNLGSYPNYGDDIRAENTRQFIQAWNNTIIPPGESGNGRSTAYFGMAPDPEAPGGAAAHGTCPPGRIVRDAGFAEGFGMPVGMQGGEDSILNGYSPAEDVKVTNTHDFPVKIVLWYEGDGPGMGIYGKFVRMKPN